MAKLLLLLNNDLTFIDWIIPSTFFSSEFVAVTIKVTNLLYQLFNECLIGAILMEFK